MKVSIIFSLISVLFTPIIFCQNEVPDAVVNRAVLVEIPNIGSGSGFFFTDSIHTYFVTALHVIANEVFDEKTSKVIDYQIKAGIAIISWYPRRPEKEAANRLEINFEQLLKDGDLKIDAQNDLVVLRIGNHIDLGYTAVEYRKGVSRLGDSQSRINEFLPSMVKKFDFVNFGNSIFILGFPKSLGLREIPTYDFNRPLLRKGIVGGLNYDHKTIIIDCPTYGGNSGGPVILAVEKDFAIKFYLIGFVSKFIPLEEIWYNPNYNIKNIELANSGYSVVIPMDSVLSLIEKF